MMCRSRRHLQTLFLRPGGGRPQDASSGTWWRGAPGVVYKDYIIISFSSKGVFVTCIVITRNINEMLARFLKKKQAHGGIVANIFYDFLKVMLNILGFCKNNCAQFVHYQASKLQEGPRSNRKLQQGPQTR
jgi:hypothetical protein